MSAPARVRVRGVCGREHSLLVPVDEQADHARRRLVCLACLADDEQLGWWAANRPRLCPRCGQWVAHGAVVRLAGRPQARRPGARTGKGGA